MSEELARTEEPSNPYRLGIMGGTFDPIHLGHLRVAEEVLEALSLDGVLFVPAGDPAFRQGQRVTDGSVRLAQVREATASNPRFDVSSLEVDREGVTYTIDTLKALRDEYPDNVQFFFILGCDAAASLPEWKDAKALSELATFAIALGRPGCQSEEELREMLSDSHGFSVEFVPVSTLEISSSEIREKVDGHHSIRYLVPERIRASVEEQGRAQAAAEATLSPRDEPDSEDALSKEFFKARKKELKERVSKKRFEHSLGVSDACASLAQIYGLDEDRARLAGLLHDWDKGYDDEGMRKRVADLGLTDSLDPGVVEQMPKVLHGITAAKDLEERYPSIPKDILQAIRRHTLADTEMEPLDMALYIADAIEPSRQFGRIDELREAVGEVSLEELFFRTYEYWTLLLLERRQPLHPDTIRIWNHYAPRMKTKEGSKGHGRRG